MPQQNVCGIVDCAVDLHSALASIKLGETYKNFYTAVGIHPECLIDENASTTTVFEGDWQRELQELEELISLPNVVAVGECGLDYHWPVPKKEQGVMFLAHIELAKKHDLPLIIHDREAHGDMYDILRQEKPSGILHCYSGSANDAEWLCKQGIYIGVGGVVTFKNSRKLQECVQALPLEKIVLETDCPYLAPVPHRGKECNSAMILHTAEKIAELKQIDLDEVLAVTCRTAKSIFNV